jgi:hypothetical protein
MLFYVINNIKDEVNFWYRGQKFTIPSGMYIVANLKHIPVEVKRLEIEGTLTLKIASEDLVKTFIISPKLKAKKK